uniref:Uncharacterized protein n=1 Tax=Arundo donax TaxID=35708 RepID=A0A0A8XYT1_ARUDO
MWQCTGVLDASYLHGILVCLFYIYDLCWCLLSAYRAGLDIIRFCCYLSCTWCIALTIKVVAI